MKSFSILILIFFTLVSVDSDTNDSNMKNITISSSNTSRPNISGGGSRHTKNPFSYNNINLNISIVADSSPLPSSVLASSSSAAESSSSSAASSTTVAFRDKRGTNSALDQSEIARQNQITQQILSNYLERRLFPHRSANQKIPTIADILPKPKTSTVRPRPRGFAASSPSFKRGAANQKRKTYGGGGQKTRNSLSQQHQQQQQNTKPEFEDVDYDDEDREKAVNYNNRKRLNNNSNGNNSNSNSHRNHQQEQPHHHHNIDDEAAELDPEEQQHTFVEDIDDIEQDGQESLQSVESEQHDHYYSTNGSSGDIFSRDPSENEIDSALQIIGAYTATPKQLATTATTDCPNCVDEMQYMNKWTMPLLKLGEKRYYLGIFFKANWFKATQYCRYHGMHLASISSQEENDRLEKHIRDFGLGNEHFWTSGTDLADEGNFFWMSTGRPITFTNWNAGEPNNFRYENGEEENCLELWNRDGKGLKWNDSPCSFETYFVCEVQAN